MKEIVLKITDYDIRSYGTSASIINIVIDENNYSFVTSNQELAQEANYKQSKMHKEALNYLIAQCLLKNEIYYDRFEIIKK